MKVIVKNRSWCIWKSCPVIGLKGLRKPTKNVVETTSFIFEGRTINP